MTKNNSEQGSNAAVVKKFADFLDTKQKRKTPERFAILDCILSLNCHFTIEYLQRMMDSTPFRVSRATLYNTMELLTQCGVIRRHVFEGMQPQYERVYITPHSHLICTECGKVKDVRDNDMLAFMNAHKKYAAFTMSYYSLHVYGICNTCARKLKREALVKKRSQRGKYKV